MSKEKCGLTVTFDIDLFTLINKRGADDCWYSELDRYLNSTRFCGLEIEYR